MKTVHLSDAQLRSAISAVRFALEPYVASDCISGHMRSNLKAVLRKLENAEGGDVREDD